MKTKEIEIKLFQCDLDRLISQQEGSSWVYREKYPLRNDVQKIVKAKLIIEVPERKIELTESQFDEAWMKSEFGNTPEEHKKNVMKKLFGSEG